MNKKVIREDCFAFVSNNVNGCYALTRQSCKNCSFYKHSDNPEESRAQIEKQLKEEGKK